jgi:hypothetical protein
MARLWQTALLSAWNPVFQYLPLESRIHEFQDEYYDAIAACHSAGKADVFVEFMLDKINLTLDWALAQVSGEDSYLSEQVRRLLDVMEYEGADYMVLMPLTDEDGEEDEEELFFLKAERTEEGEVYSAIEDENLLNAIADAYEKEFIEKMKASSASQPEGEEN